MGGGDVKLIAAAGCNAGLSLIGPLLILTSLAGGVMAVGLALYHRRLKETVLNMCALAVHHRASWSGAPSGVQHRQCANAALALCIGYRRGKRS